MLTGTLSASNPFRRLPDDGPNGTAPAEPLRQGTVYIDQSKEINMFENDRTQPVERRRDREHEQHIEVIELGDAAELTLGSGGSGSEDKRRQYN